jgi:hypothetical protein
LKATFIALADSFWAAFGAKGAGQIFRVQKMGTGANEGNGERNLVRFSFACLIWSHAPAVLKSFGSNRNSHRCGD